MRNACLLAASAIVLATTSPVAAQTTSPAPTVGDRLGQILGNLLGVDNRAANSLEGQWTANRRPFSNQRYDFEARVNAEVSAGKMSQTTATRLKADYLALVDREATYGTDGVYTTAERTDLTTRYNELLGVLTNGRYAETVVSLPSEVAAGQAAFNARVNAQVTKRKITRAAATRLKSDYAAVVKIEANYIADGTVTEAERDDLDERLDALDARVGDVAYVVPVTFKTRLEGIRLALPASGLTVVARNQLEVERGDLIRLEAAYAKLTPTSEEKAYLEKRIADLELRARVQR